MSKPAQPLFILDIGTRKVAGVVVKPKGQGLKVLAARVLEHPDRAMRDGQVHRVEAVAEVVKQVKSALEADMGHPLPEAAVAAAGRALLTQSAAAHRRYPCPTEVTREDLLALELAAARAAQSALQPPGGKRQLLHCVGFSVVKFQLDQESLDDLAGHRGREISVEVLATFLPRQVVDSLMAVLRRAKLAATSLTLEPIAALEATLPPDLRRMNIALVDVGAGTSDIALTREGSVFGYAMVTQAGDEITERLCEHYLLEFNEAERIKRLLDTAGEAPLAFTSILGKIIQKPAAEIIEHLSPDVSRLARAIAEAISKLNGQAPRAVVMVGGGSATPGLGEAVAEILGMDPHRVGTRGPDSIKGLENPTQVLHGIEGVTPLGIGMLAVQGRGLKFISAQVNGQSVQLLALTEEPTVFDALLSAGREVRHLYPRPGQAVTYTLNGRLITRPGTLGQPAHLQVNDADATLDTVVEENARIAFQEARDGEDAVLTPADVAKPKGPHWCTINGQNRELNLQLLYHGQPLDPEQPIPDRAELTWVSSISLLDLIPELEQAPERVLRYRVSVDGRQREVVQQQGIELKVNGRSADHRDHPRPNDRVEWTRSESGGLRLSEVVGDLPATSRITVQVNGQTKALDTGGCRLFVNGQPASQEEVVPDQAEIVVETLASAPPIMSQALVDLDLKPPKNAGPLIILVDGQKAAFTTPLRNGSQIEITFG